MEGASTHQAYGEAERAHVGRCAWEGDGHEEAGDPQSPERLVEHQCEEPEHERVL